VSNNKTWVLEELKGWIQQGISSLKVDELNMYTTVEKVRSTEKINTMIMVLKKIDELENR